MAKEDLKHRIVPGSVVREGKSHFLTVTNIYGKENNNPAYQYWEDDYYHETNLEYITGIVIDSKDPKTKWVDEVE